MKRQDKENQQLHYFYMDSLLLFDSDDTMRSKNSSSTDVKTKRKNKAGLANSLPGKTLTASSSMSS